MSTLRKGIIYASVTAFLWGFLAIGLKVATAKVEPTTIVWFRFAVAFFSLLVFHLFRSPSEIKILIKPPWLLVVAALGLSWNYMGFMLGIHYTTPSNAQVVIQTGPITLAMVGIIVFREKVRYQQVLGFLLAIAGLATFYHHQIKLMIGAEDQYNMGFLFTVSGALAWTIYASVQKKLVVRFSTATLNLFLFGLPAIIYLPFINLEPLAGLHWGWWVLLVFLGLNTLIAYGSLSMALKFMEASKVSIIIILNPIITFIVMGALTYAEVSWITAEKFSVLSLVGAAIVLTGAVAIGTKKENIKYRNNLTIRYVKKSRVIFFIDLVSKLGGKYFVMKQLQILVLPILLFMLSCSSPENNYIVTVNGKIAPEQMGKTLHHEHVLVDFIGAAGFSKERYDRDSVIKKVLPEIEKLKKFGVNTFIECTPQFLGRDVLILKELSEKTGVNFITNTGFYGAFNNKFIPEHVLKMTPEMIAQYWIAESEQGIEGTGIHPGFIKIAVERKPLSDFHRTLVRAAAITHKATGLTIMSHTGPAVGAFQELEILKEEGVSPEAFIWTHAHNERDLTKHIEAARLGCWVAFDKFWGGEKDIEIISSALLNMKKHNLLHKVLISHDAGWFAPKRPDKKYQPHTLIFKELIPVLKKNGFSDNDLDQILIENPARAFTVKKSLLK